MLTNYPDVQLVDQLEFGWPLDYSSIKPPTPTFRNHANASDLVEHVAPFIQVAHRAMLGPFISLPFKPWCQLAHS